jgi:hypothetical protein
MLNDALPSRHLPWLVLLYERSFDLDLSRYELLLSGSLSGCSQYRQIQIARMP